MMDLSRRGWRRSEPINIGDPEQPELLAQVMTLLEGHRGFTFDQLGDELALSPDNIAPFIDTLSEARLSPSI
jgi:hypothetical protein